MIEWTILHRVIIKSQIIYPLILLIIIFSVYETVGEYLERKEREKWNKNIC